MSFTARAVSENDEDRELLPDYQRQLKAARAVLAELRS